jgi:predicted phosphohydrolase
MSIFAIGDLHLSLTQDKPMDIFGEKWVNHVEKLRVNWLDQVSENDVVLLAGDHSWALKLEEAIQDLEFIGSLPGKKILVKGNHDFWWQSLSKVKQVLPSSMFLLQNNFYWVEGVAICGTRGWVCPTDDDFASHDFKIYRRELLRLESSLNSAKKEWPEQDIIVVLHFHPFDNQGRPSDFVGLMQEYGVKTCVYGHLHGNSHQNAVNGTVEGISYHLVACDSINFTPLLIKR